MTASTNSLADRLNNEATRHQTIECLATGELVATGVSEDVAALVRSMSAELLAIADALEAIDAKLGALDPRPPHPSAEPRRAQHPALSGALARPSADKGLLASRPARVGHRPRRLCDRNDPVPESRPHLSGVE